MPAAVWKKRRRLTPWRSASLSPRSLSRASTSRCFSVCGAGRYSSLETIWVGMGEGNSSSSAPCSACICSGVIARMAASSVFDLDVDGLGLAAELERGLVPVGRRQELARVVGDAVALRRNAGCVAVELAVVVLVVERGHRVAARRQVVEGDADRPGRSLLTEGSDLLALLGEGLLAGEDRRRHRALGVVRAAQLDGEVGCVCGQRQARGNGNGDCADHVLLLSGCD